MVEHKFFNLSNSIVLIIMWGSFAVLIINSIFKPSQLLWMPQNIDYISLFAAYSAITGILYSNFKSDLRNEKSLENSNNQLIEQLTRDKKEKAIFLLIKKILSIINDDLKKDFIPWSFTAKTIADYYEENKINFDSTNVDFNLFVQNELYFYFSNLFNNPYLFNYLSPEIQKEINGFVLEYYEFYRDFYLFMGNKIDNSIEFSRKYEFKIMDDNSKRIEYFKSGNYLIKKEAMGSSLFDFAFKSDLKLTDKTIVIKIKEKDYNKLNCILQKIVFLSYNESLKYGYNEL